MWASLVASWQATAHGSHKESEMTEWPSTTDNVGKEIVFLFLLFLFL